MRCISKLQNEIIYYLKPFIADKQLIGLFFRSSLFNKQFLECFLLLSSKIMKKEEEKNISPLNLASFFLNIKTCLRLDFQLLKLHYNKLNIFHEKKRYPHYILHHILCIFKKNLNISLNFVKEMKNGLSRFKNLPKEFTPRSFSISTKFQHIEYF